MSKNNGYARFDFYLLQLEQLLTQSVKEKNPALWLYSNNARTPLFMLESLAKIYGAIHNKKKFGKLKEHFKLLEDGIGSIDYYDSFAKEFATNPNIPAGITSYVAAQAREKIQRLNDILSENEWIGDKPKRISKIRKKLDEADWLNAPEEVSSMLRFYQESIKDIKDFMPVGAEGFTEVELEVHEMRRKLRWLSIYPQALQGVIQLTDSQENDESCNRYLTTEIVNSPFNKMPDAGINEYLLLLEKKQFLCLSWMIAELGKLKDNGLRIMVMTEAIQQTEAKSHGSAMHKACEILGGDDTVFTNILTTATDMCKRYFEEKHLDKLLRGVSQVKK